MSANRLLQSLPPDLLKLVELDLEPVRLELRQVVAQRGAPLEHVYFPTTSLISVVVSYENGNTIEAELVGNDAYNGLSIVLNGDGSTNDMFVQIAGEALRMDAADFRHHLVDSRFRSVLSTYSANAFSILGQLAGCVAFHPVEQRLARWLLMVGDRVDLDELPLTHEFLGIMLGVYRPTVTIAVNLLDRAGVIETKRGRIRIVDHDGLKSAACECYGVIRALAGDLD